MGDRKYLDLAISQPADQAEGKPGEKVTPGASTVSWPPVRGLRYDINSTPQLFAEAARCNLAALSVPLVGCCFLGRRRRNLTAVGGTRAAVQSRPQFTPRDGFDRAGVEFGHAQVSC
ncbi:MAG TPA: hypothetical protein VHM88_22130 [Candidatus Acidoferrales bacterium]|nr:hypothetical protein [Candidatus Acidoferrales bacterium]